MRKRAQKKEKQEENEKPKQLTQEEQDEADEKALEEACEKWCSRIIRVAMLGWMFWGVLTSFSQWLFRPPVLLEATNLRGRLFVLTGGTEGIGAAAASRLVQDGARVVMGARDMDKAEAFAAELKLTKGQGSVEVRYLNLANLSSVVHFAKTFDNEDDGIDALLNNAGSIDKPCVATMDAFESVTQVNYLAPILLTKLLQPALEAADNGRVVFVSCPAARSPQANLDPAHLEELNFDDEGDINAKSECDVFTRYASAKLMLHDFNAKLAQKLARSGSSVTSNIFDPSSVDTPGNAALMAVQPAPKSRMRFNPQVIIRQIVGFIFSPITGPIYRRVARMFLRRASEGGHGLVHMATSPHLRKVNGKVFSLAANSGLTKLAGCGVPQDECGMESAPRKIADNEQQSLWELTHESLTPWLPSKTGKGKKRRRRMAEEEEEE